jgi:NAD(P)H-flavin reductase
MVKKYNSEIVSIGNPLPDIYTVEFQSLSGKYRYYPGQFLHLALDEDYEGYGQWPDSRCFSIQNPPEGNVVKITFSVKGKFTTQMKESFSPGRKVWLKMPYGELFTQPHHKENTVFIAGGTGVTPYLSLFGHSWFKDYTKPKVYLGFRTKAHNIYRKELNHIPDDKLRIYYEDINGRINPLDIINENPNFSSVFISGPPDMIAFYKESLAEVGVSKDLIFTDDWG